MILIDSDKDDDNDEFQTRMSMKERLKYKSTYTICMFQRCY